MRRRTTPARLRHLAVAALTIGATALVGTLAAAPAEAAGPKHPRVLPIAATSDWLVYRQQTGNAYDVSFPKGSRLWYVGEHGARHALRDFDPERAQTLHGSLLVQADSWATTADPTAPEHLHWRDLASGRSGDSTLPAGEDLVGAAPGGWISRRTDGSALQLVRHTTDGRSSSFGAPLNGAGPTGVTIGPKGVVAAAGNTAAGNFDEQRNGSGRVRYATFREPGTWRTVLAAGAGIDTSCGTPSATHVVCWVESHAAKHNGSVLVALNGTHATWVGDHRSVCPVISFTAVGSTAVGKASNTQSHCIRGRLTQLSAAGRVKTPKRGWGSHSSYITAGLSGILLDTSDQRRIVRLSSVDGKARTVVTAR